MADPNRPCPWPDRRYVTYGTCSVMLRAYVTRRVFGRARRASNGSTALSPATSDLLLTMAEPQKLRMPTVAG